MRLRHTHLAVLGSSPHEAEIFSVVNGVPLHTAFHYHPHLPDMTEILLKGRKIASHPSSHQPEGFEQVPLSLLGNVAM